MDITIRESGRKGKKMVMVSKPGHLQKEIAMKVKWFRGRGKVGEDISTKTKTTMKENGKMIPNMEKAASSIPIILNITAVSSNVKSIPILYS